VLAVVFLFCYDLIRHLFDLPALVHPMFSMEIGLLLVSVKIIWMIHKQTKVDHFQFWILNSIEFRLNEIAKDIRQIKRKVDV